MTTKNNKQDNEVYILGSDSPQKPDNNKRNGFKWLWLAVFILVAAIAAGLFIYFFDKDETPEYFFEPEETVAETVSVITADTAGYKVKTGYIETVLDSVNDVPLIMHMPHNARMKLQVGMPDRSDSTIVFAAMAADIRKDNQQIVGDFVLNGKRLARGDAKKGFCAIDGDKVTIGLGETTPLLQQAIDNNGSFFRQYPLVNNGQLIENKPKGKAIRRALAIREDRMIMIESKNRESFYDFSQALVDIGVTEAIYLVGGNAYGWYRDKEHVSYEFGEELPELPENISYIIWQIE